ncbi:hypothetical protein B0H13DRAFT_2402371 [Mycena leptocephala]|nr:hypothetical protein B0H13DRAFT_2402371 [Mycena leptocephala]
MASFAPLHHTASTHRSPRPHLNTMAILTPTYSSTAHSPRSSILEPSLHISQIQRYTFLSFIKRASAIQSFSAGFSALSLPDGSMTAILGAMPTLTSLDLRLDTQAATIFDILRLLNESTTFLPHLRKLHLTLFSMSWKDHFTAIFVDALTSRWEAKSGIAQLVDFDLRLLPLVELDGKVLDCISKLKDKGMRIEVGPWTR